MAFPSAKEKPAKAQTYTDCTYTLSLSPLPNVRKCVCMASVICWTHFERLKTTEDDEMGLLQWILFYFKFKIMIFWCKQISF